MRIYLYTLWVLIGIVGSCKQPEEEKYNVIQIVVDDLGWTDLGCYGSTFYETPNIDKLAAEGIRFTDAYSTCSLCSPSRGSIMTGRYPTRTGITNWIMAHYQLSQKLPEIEIDQENFETKPGWSLATPVNVNHLDTSEVTIAEILRDNGYTTCHIGKWHLGGEDHYPEHHGFDFNIGGCDLGEPPSYFDPYYRAAGEIWPGEPEIYEIPTLEPRTDGEYLTDREADEALEFIRDHHQVPFFLNLSHYAVHFPIQAKEEYIEKYRHKQPSEHHSDPVYAAMIQSVDEGVGVITELLDSLGLAERTLILFTSDNGGLTYLDITSNYPLKGGKATPWEGGIRVPLIVKWPGYIVPGTESRIPVTGTDLFPTIIEITGSNSPDDQVIDGVSLVPALAGTTNFSRGPIFWHYPHYRPNSAPYSIIREDNWKLIRFYDLPENRILLFDLETDISEEEDVADKFPEMVEELSEKLDQWLDETGGRLPVANRENIQHSSPSVKTDGK